MISLATQEIILYLCINYLFLLIPACILCLHLLTSTDNPQQEEQGCAPTRGKRTEKEMEAVRHAAQRPIYAELNFADQRPVPPPASDTFVAGYAEVGQA